MLADMPLLEGQFDWVDPTEGLLEIFVLGEVCVVTNDFKGVVLVLVEDVEVSGEIGTDIL